jgi:hypothetical protein
VSTSRGRAAYHKGVTEEVTVPGPANFIQISSKLGGGIVGTPVDSRGPGGSFKSPGLRQSSIMTRVCRSAMIPFGTERSEVQILSPRPATP